MRAVSWRTPAGARLRLSTGLASAEVLAVVVGLGIALRVSQYLANRSLWLDEALLALNIIDRSPSELLGTLDFNQAAPPGFLLLEHGVAALFGYSEPALRAIPLIAGIASVIVFAWLARRILNPRPALFAVLVFSLSDGLIYYASEVKPYSVDVLATLLLLVGAVLLGNGISSRRSAGLVGVLGAMLMTVSYAAVLVAASIAMCFVSIAARENRATNSARCLPLLLWSGFGITIAAYSWANAGGIKRAFEISEPRAPFNAIPAWLDDLVHQVNVLATDLLGTIGFLYGSPWNHLLKVAALTFVIGAVALGHRAPLHLMLLLTPIVLALVAWSIGQYPLTPRTTLFLVPSVILLLAGGAAAMMTWTPISRHPIVGMLVALGLLVGPVWTAGKAVTQPRAHEELKPVINYIQRRWTTGDTLYVHYAAQYALLYYDECECQGESPWRLASRGGREQFAPALDPVSENIVVGSRASAARQVADLGRLRAGTRVWFLYTHVGDPTEETFIQRRLVARLDAIGNRLAGIDRAGAHAYLYRLDP